LGHSAGLVIATQDCQTVGVARLKSNKQCHCLNRVVASVDIVTHEEVVLVGQVTSNAEELNQVMELTVDITANGDWCSHFLDIRLVDKNLFGLITVTKKLVLPSLQAL